MRTHHIFAVVAFFALLVLPAAQNIFGFVELEGIDENRKLSSPPILDFSDPRRVILDSKKWFEDHFGFRAVLIRLKAQIDYTVFNTSGRVHIGKDGYLFYRSVLDDERFVVDNLLKIRMDEVIGGIKSLRDDLRKSGKYLIILVAPSKEVLYPEMLPASVPNFPKPSQIEILRTRINEIPGITFIDPVPALRDLKSSRSVFFKTDAHWTSPAAYTVGKMLIDAIASNEGVPSPWHHPLKVERVSFSGGEAHQLPLFWPPLELADKIISTAPNHQVVKLATNVPPFAYMHLVSPSEPGLLPCTVVVGDSFWMGIQVTGAPVYFKGFYQATWYRFNDFKALLDTPSECKYFVYEFVEGNRLAIETLASYR